MRLLAVTVAVNLVLTLPFAFAQHEGMNMPDSPEAHSHTEPGSFIGRILHHSDSGTGAQPDSTPSAMMMTHKGGWELMFHANAFVTFEQESGPRGFDKVFSTNW